MGEEKKHNCRETEKAHWHSDGDVSNANLPLCDYYSYTGELVWDLDTN